MFRYAFFSKCTVLIYRAQREKAAIHRSHLRRQTDQEKEKMRPRIHLNLLKLKPQKNSKARLKLKHLPKNSRLRCSRPYDKVSNYVLCGLILSLKGSIVVFQLFVSNQSFNFCRLNMKEVAAILLVSMVNFVNRSGNKPRKDFHSKSWLGFPIFLFFQILDSVFGGKRRKYQ